MTFMIFLSELEAANGRDDVRQTRLARSNLRLLQLYGVEQGMRRPYLVSAYVLSQPKSYLSFNHRQQQKWEQRMIILTYRNLSQAVIEWSTRDQSLQMASCISYMSHMHTKRWNNKGI